jgi:hypothetical protein
MDRILASASPLVTAPLNIAAVFVSRSASGNGV